MKDNDRLHRFVFENAPVRGEIVHLDATWKAVLERRDYPEPVRRLLGEMMAATALLCASIKFSGSLIMQIMGSGPIRLLVVECSDTLVMRAMAQWAEDEIEPAPVHKLLGAGKFVITIDPGQGKQTYQGIVELQGDSVAEMLESYMMRSEQLDTRLWLSSDQDRAAGMLLQRMPGGDGPDDDAWNRAAHLGATITHKELLNVSAEQVIRRLYHEEDIRLFEAKPVNFYCGCSHEKVAGLLRMLGYAEVHAILEEQGSIQVDCEFCNRHYEFDRVDAEQLFAAGVVPPPGGLH